MADKTFVKYYCFSKDLAEKKHNLSSDSIYAALTNTAPNVSTHTSLASITELSTSGGYTAGGQACAVTEDHTTGVYKITADADVEWTGSAAGFTARYLVLYNYTSAGDELIGYYDYGSSQAIQSGEVLKFDCSAKIIAQIT
ncbi:MAG: hypothetical protein WC455_18375 [Dehalococcoidia bacterium]|jgi:hypothetical protein